MFWSPSFIYILKLSLNALLLYVIKLIEIACVFGFYYSSSVQKDSIIVESSSQGHYNRGLPSVIEYAVRKENHSLQLGKFWRSIKDDQSICTCMVSCFWFIDFLSSGKCLQICGLLSTRAITITAESRFSMIPNSVFYGAMSCRFDLCFRNTIFRQNIKIIWRIWGYKFLNWEIDNSSSILLLFFRKESCLTCLALDGPRKSYLAFMMLTASIVKIGRRLVFIFNPLMMSHLLEWS